jgi:hypothetical protein
VRVTDGAVTLTGKLCIPGDSSFAGKVGIGTTSAPTVPLDVIGGLWVLSGSNPRSTEVCPSWILCDD